MEIKKENENEKEINDQNEKYFNRKNEDEKDGISFESFDFGKCDNMNLLENTGNSTDGTFEHTNDEQKLKNEKDKNEDEMADFSIQQICNDKYEEEVDNKNPLEDDNIIIFEQENKIPDKINSNTTLKDVCKISNEKNVNSINTENSVNNSIKSRGNIIQSSEKEKLKEEELDDIRNMEVNKDLRQYKKKKKQIFISRKRSRNPKEIQDKFIDNLNSGNLS